jgi:hypothetical protein
VSIAAVENRMRLPRRAEPGQMLRDEATQIEARLQAMFAARSQQPMPAQIEHGRKQAR